MESDLDVEEGVGGIQLLLEEEEVQEVLEEEEEMVELIQRIGGIETTTKRLNY